MFPSAWSFSGSGILKLALAVVVAVVLVRAWRARSAAWTGPMGYNEFYSADDAAGAADHSDDTTDAPATMMTTTEAAAETEGFQDYASWTADASPATVIPTDGMAPPAVSTALLPKPDPTQSSWAQFAPTQLRGQQFLSPEKYIGVNTQGNFRKNASHDLRRTYVIPKREVGPWNQSTIDPDLTRRNLDM